MRVFVILMVIGITWTQVTPTDNQGCAGYSPTITDQPTRVESLAPTNTPDFIPRDDSDSGGQGQPQDRGHHFGDNRGHGQFDDRGWSGKNTDED